MKLAISLGDLNGIGLEIALRSHASIREFCTPIYCINEYMLHWGAAMLGLEVPDDFAIAPCGEVFDITPGKNTKEAGKQSFESFQKAIDLCIDGSANAIVTLPINKESWAQAGIKYKGHTDALSEILDVDAIMMLGCEKMFVVLYTHHIPLKDVCDEVKTKKLQAFLRDVQNFLHVDKIGVLGLNPHAGDNGVIGTEDLKIKKAIKKVNEELGAKIFLGPLVPDTAFTPANRDKFQYYICMYHDQGLIPLKTLYFEESINVSLNSKIIRTSVDHGTAFDIAYKNRCPANISYINAVKEAVKQAKIKENLVPKSI